MDAYNRKGIFSNLDDTIVDLEHALHQRFSAVTLVIRELRRFVRNPRLKFTDGR